jgi:hypothetical protein
MSLICDIGRERVKKLFFFLNASSDTRFHMLTEKRNTISQGDKPVPRGTMAMGGDWHIASCPTLSRHDSTHPTLPSPPHTKIL